MPTRDRVDDRLEWDAETFETVQALKAALLKTQADLQESRAELARLVRVTEDALSRRTRTSEEVSEAILSASLGIRHGALDGPAGASDDAPWHGNDGRRTALIARRLARFISLIAPSRVQKGPVSLATETKIISALYEAELLDPDYYLKTNPDVAQSGFDPGRHFLEYGLYEGRRPSRLFADDALSPSRS